MSSGNPQPFIGSLVFDKVNSTYITFPSQADAMLASLQLFHDVPCHIMNLVFSVITHPEFDSKQVTLLGSANVIDVVEENRLKDRMAVVQERSASRDGRVKQAGFPQFILDEVLDIIHAERITSIKARFEETLRGEEMYFESMDIEEDDTLNAMTVVHRSWTNLAQKALGRVLHIGRPTDEMNILLSPVRKSIFGPWTSAVAVQFYHPITETPEISGYEEYKMYDYSVGVHANDEYRGWFENLHRILVGFANLKCLYIKSYASLFTSWSGLTFASEMVRRNVCLEEVTVYAMPSSGAFELNPLIENAAVLKNLRSLNIQGARISDMAVQSAMQGPGFANLTNVTIECLTSLKNDLRLLSILLSQSNSRLESLRITDVYERESFEEDIRQAFTPSQCAAVFGPLRALHINSQVRAEKWFKWIGPFCSTLESLSLISYGSRQRSLEEDVAQAFTPWLCATILEQLRSLDIDDKDAADVWLKWFAPSCSGLQSMTLAMNVSLAPNTLNLIPITIRSLDVSLWTASDTTFEEITGWMKWLLKIVSSMHFSKLKSFTLFVSEGYLQSEINEARAQLAQTFHTTQMQNFKEEMSAVCEGVGVECCLDF